MNTRTTFIVLLIAVALATYFIVFELNPEDSDSPDPSTSLTSQAGEPLFDQAVESSKITKLTIRRGDAQPIVIERLPRDGWRQTQPVAWAANSWKIDSVADAAAGISYSRTLKSDLTPSAYGFSPAETTIEIAGDDFAHTIHLGREATAGKAFVTVDDGKAITWSLMTCTTPSTRSSHRTIAAPRWRRWMRTTPRPSRCRATDGRSR